MNDTPETIDAIYRKMIMARSAAERLHMASSMHDTARKLMRAGITAREQNLSPAQLRARIFVRLYGSDFTPSQQKKIMKSMPDMQYDSEVDTCL